MSIVRVPGFHAHAPEKPDFNASASVWQRNRFETTPVRSATRSPVARAAMGVAFNALIIAAFGIFLVGIGSPQQRNAILLFVIVSTGVMSADVAREFLTAEFDRLPGSRWSRLLNHATGVLLLLLFLAGLQHVGRNVVPLASIALFLCFVAMGACLRLTSIIILRERFVSDDHPTRNRPREAGLIFHWTRHPSELGLLIIGWSICWIACSAAVTSLAVALTICSLVRIISEETAFHGRE